MTKRRVLRPPTSKQLVVPRLDESGQVIYEEAHGPIKPSDSSEGRFEFDDADRPITTPQQKQQLKQWHADGKQWISIDALIELIRNCTGTTKGYAQKLWKDARASGEVRYANDDKLKDPHYDYAGRKDDLEGWLDRRGLRTDKPATKQKTKVHHYRHAGDAGLVARGLKLVAKGASNSEAARRLAPHAIGGTLEQRIDRLRRLVGKLAVIGSAKHRQS